MKTKAQMSGSEILAAEKAVEERHNNRNAGYGLMKVRDTGFVSLSNGVDMYWPAPPTVYQPEDGIEIGDEVFKSLTIDNGVPEGMFKLRISGLKSKDGQKVESKDIYFDAEEFRKSLRWV